MDQVVNWFSYHRPPSEAVAQKYERIRSAGLALAHTILSEATGITGTPDDLTVAIQKVREAVMWANAYIACGKVIDPCTPTNLPPKPTSNPAP